MYQGLSLDQAPPQDIPFRFFLTAPLFWILLGLLLAWQGGDLFESYINLSTVAFTHLFTLGWLAMIMIGAFYQMIPVMVGGEVPFLELSRWVHTFILFGLVGLIVFLFFPYSQLLPWPMAALGLGFLLFLSQMGKTLFWMRGGRPTLSAMRASIVCLALVVLLGLAMLGEYASWWQLPWEREQTRALHILFGLGGWVGLLLIGVSFHILPMFYVTPGLQGPRAERILLHIYITLFLLPISILFNLPWGWKLAASSFGLFGLGNYVVTMWGLLGQRRRKKPDPTVWLWQWGLFYIALFTLTAGGLWVPQFDSAFGFIVLLLFLGGAMVNITCGMLFKIVPFLVWFHRFSGLIGRVDIPMLGDLLSDEVQFRFAKALNGLILLIFASLLLRGTFFLPVLGVAWAGLGFILWEILFSVYRYPLKLAA